MTDSFARFTPEAKHVMNLARQECQRLGHDFMGPEHFLLGMLASTECLALSILRQCELDPSAVRAEVEEILAAIAPHAAVTGNLPFTDRAKRVLETAFEEWKMSRRPNLGTGHLLIALLDVPGTVPYRVLDRQTVRADCVRDLADGCWESAPHPSVDDTGRRVAILRDAVEILRAIGRDDAALAVEHAVSRVE